MDRGATELITDEAKPGILSSTFHFPEIMLNIITRGREIVTRCPHANTSPTRPHTAAAITA